jgi:aspartate/methionine/tyrosine aminotransferase
MSGMRIGCLYTRNKALTGALDNLGYFAMPSTLTQEAIHQLLSEADFVRSYIEENARRLGASYDALTGASLLLLWRGTVLAYLAANRCAPKPAASLAGQWQSILCAGSSCWSSFCL